MLIDKNPRLDDLYKMVAYHYNDKNMNRTSTATFTRFVDVCGMLTVHDRKSIERASTLQTPFAKR